eukprot:999505_1
MDDSAWFNKSLEDFVDSANNLNELTSLLSFVPLGTTKQFIKEQIASLDTDTSRTAYYNSLSIDSVLPSSITQYCLSFDHGLHLRHISKSFKTFSDHNQRILMRQLQAIANQQPFDHQIKFDEDINQIYVVDASRTTLNETESNLKYKGPFDNLTTPMSLCKNGDKILLHGTIANDAAGACTIYKDIQIIGIGENAILKDVANDGYALGIFRCTRVYFENITFDSESCDNLLDGFLYLSDNAKLYLKDCKIKVGHYGIMALDNTTLCALNCAFDGGCTGVRAIHMDPTATVNLFGCRFTGFGHEHSMYGIGEGDCIEIASGYEQVTGDMCVHLKCVANVFVNNFGYSIAFRYSNALLSVEFGYQVITFCEHILQRNILQGYNGLYVRKKVRQANMIYHNEQPYNGDAY